MIESQTPHKLYPRPAGEAPAGNESCPLCKQPPGVAHKARCPWLLWAMWPADHKGTQ